MVTTIQRMSAWALALLLVTLTVPSRACPDYPAQVPGSSCVDCHGSASFSAPPNVFGADYNANCAFCVATCSGCSYIAWSDCVASGLDSDGDGFTNDEELIIETPPGDFTSGIDECTTPLHRCTSDATCTLDGTVRHDYTCVCSPGLTAAGSDGRSDGTGCIDLDECTLGTHDCGANSTCSNTRGSFDCPCTPGYFGSGHASIGCTTDNFCGPGPCGPLSLCGSTPAGATCSPCPLGYQGDPIVDGCTSIDACATDNGGCSARVTCQPLPGGRSCGACPTGWAGTGVGANGCLEDVCARCSPFATCTPGGSPVCACNAGFSGDGTSCRDVDECAPGGSARCGEHMSCANLFGSSECVCDDGYHWAGDACVLGAIAFSRVDLAPAPPLSDLERGVSAGSSSCALAPRATSGAPASAWGWLAFAASMLAWRRRSPWLPGAVAISLLGCGNGSDPNGAGGSTLDAGTGGLGGGGGTNGQGAVAGSGTAGNGGGLPPRPCALSRDCAAGEWCNPGGDECQRRDSPGTAYTFQDIHEILESLTCTSCHTPGGEADFATTGANFGPLTFDNFELAYRHLVVDGVSCQATQHRLCVEEPRDSLLITKVFEGLNEKQELVVFRDWSDETLQKMLRWIASGTPRRGPSCGNRDLDAGEQCDKGLTPPARCAYGETSCELCSSRCTLAPPVAGPLCGDGNIDDGHETCDDGNAVTESAPTNGGAVCGSQCTFVAGL